MFKVVWRKYLEVCSFARPIVVSFAFFCFLFLIFVIFFSRCHFVIIVLNFIKFYEEFIDYDNASIGSSIFHF